MNEGTIEAIIRDMMPDYCKKILLAGNEEYTTMVLVWEGDDSSGTILTHLFDQEGEPISVHELKDVDIRKGVKVLLNLRNSKINSESHPTKVIVVEK